MIRTLFASSVLALAIGSSQPAADKAGALSGSSYALTISGDDQPDHGNILSFEGSDGTAANSAAHGFAPAQVVYTRVGDTLTFAFTQRSKRSGTVTWQGVAADQGAMVAGTKVWIEHDAKKVHIFTFTGTRLPR